MKMYDNAVTHTKIRRWMLFPDNHCEGPSKGAPTPQNTYAWQQRGDLANNQKSALPFTEMTTANYLT